MSINKKYFFAKLTKKIAYDTIIAQYLSREFFNYVTEESDKLTVKIAEKFENTPLSSIK